MPAPTKQPLQILHAHTTLSILDGASTVKEYVQYAHDNGLKVCSCSDHGYVMAVHELLKECKKKDVQPVPGCEFYLDLPKWYKFLGKPFSYFHLTVWAMNAVGHQNLMRLSSLAWKKVVKKFGLPKPVLDWEDLALCNEGLLIGSGCIEGPIGKPLVRGEIDMAVENAAALRTIFGDRLYFEIMPSRVVRNYYKVEMIEVQDTNGNTYTFLPTDLVETDDGWITAKEAAEKQVGEIYGSVPQRFQDRMIPQRGMENARPIEMPTYLQPDDCIEDNPDEPEPQRKLGE
jgi:DNA polymerase-3 subunit alpha